jgi:hypothetical protein
VVHFVQKCPLFQLIQYEIWNRSFSATHLFKKNRDNVFRQNGKTPFLTCLAD